MARNYGFAVSPAWKAILHDNGVRYEDVLRAARLPEDLLERPHPRLMSEAFFRFCRAADEAVDDPTFLIRMAESQEASMFSPPVFAALCSPNLGVAARRLARFKPLLAPIELHISEDVHGLHVRFEWLEALARPPCVLMGYEALFVVNLARTGTRRRVVPRRVSMPTLPDPLAPFEAFFGTRVQQGPIQVSFYPEDVALPFMTSDVAMWELFEPDLRRRLADLEGSATFAERTRAVLLEALPSGLVSIEQTATRLAVSTRTLQRRLREENTTFQRVVQRTRQQLAHHYLADSNLTSTEIAYLLGFEEPSSFFRAFQDWTGQTPDRARRARVEG